MSAFFRRRFLSLQRMVLSLVGLVAVVVYAHVARSAPGGARHVLVLNAYHPTYGWTANIVEGVRAVLDRVDNVDLAIEFMDTKKVYNPDYARDLVHIYSQKFAKIHFDVIISSDDDALNFLLEYRDTLFPGVPVVFCGVNQYRDGRLRGQTGFTGVNEENSLDKSLELIASQRPSTRKIVLLADKTATGIVFRKMVEGRRPEWDQRFEFSVMTDFTASELQSELRRLPMDAAVIWAVFMRDKADAPLSFSESLKLVVEASPVPVYGFMDITVSQGAVGGYVVSGFAQGETAAKIALRIMGGEPVDSIPVVRDSPNVYMFDYQALRRFHLDESRVPPGSVVKNRPFSFYEQYKRYVWAALLGMGLESVAILVLIGVIRAITRTSRARLRASEERYRSIVEDGTDCIGRFDTKGTMVFANHALGELAAAHGEQAEGLSYFEIAGVDGDAVQRRMQQLTRQSPTFELETRVRAIGDRVHWIHWVLRGFFDEGGRLVEVQAVGHDTTEQRSAMEKVIQARANLQGVLDGMREGLVVCGLDGRLTEIRSKAVVDWFGLPGEGCTLWDYVYPEEDAQKQSLMVAFEQIAEDVLPFEVAAQQMPSLLHKGESVFRLSCEPLMRGESLSGVIVVLADVTEQLRQEQLDRVNRELPTIVGHLLRDREGFRSFVNEINDLLERITTTDERSVVLRMLHTIKGNTAIYGFEHFASLCHDLETAASLDAGEPSPESIRKLSEAWDMALRRVCAILDPQEEQLIRVKPAEFEDLLQRLRLRDHHSTILRSAQRWTQPTMAEMLGIYVQTIERLGARFGKDVEATVLDNGLRLPRGEFRRFMATLVHVVRNAVDHGIERPEERERSGKPGSGHTVISSALENGHFVITVRDDGRGIDWEIIRERAKRLGLPAETHEDLIEALFHDGLTSKDQVTETSGRGVGLGAVREACINLGGVVNVHTEQGKGTTFEFRFFMPSLVPPPLEAVRAASSAP